MKARFVLEEDSRWAIGDGPSVSVWRDRWVPRPLTFRILTPPPRSMENLLVSDLISHENKLWRVDLLPSLFDAEEVRLISSIPLSFRGVPDRIMWHYDRTGQFSAKSAYK